MIDDEIGMKNICYNNNRDTCSALVTNCPVAQYNYVHSTLPYVEHGNIHTV